MSEHDVGVDIPGEQNDPAGQTLEETVDEMDPPGQNRPGGHVTHEPAEAKNPEAQEQLATLADADGDTAPEGHENDTPPAQKVLAVHGPQRLLLV